MGKRLLAYLIPVFMVSCNYDGGGEYQSVQGLAQGTSYRVTFQHPTVHDLKPQIDSVLQAFDMSLSAYEPGSIISAVNRNERVAVDSLFKAVFRESARVYQLTGGAFDITLGPVIDAWGFGPGEPVQVDSAMVDSLLNFVGMDKVDLRGDTVVKSIPQVTLNVNAIAQGFAVDVVSGFLDGLGCVNYLVEIGGEIRTRGRNPKGSFWRIGVDRPEYGNMVPGSQMQAILNMHDRALATSGNYRKFYEKDGMRITHSIDPATGYPKESRLLSATVLAPECITADAYATACMVMGLDRARQFIESQQDVDAYFVYGEEDGNYQVWHTDGLRKYIELP